MPSTRVSFHDPGDEIRLRGLGPRHIRSLQESVAASKKTSFDFSDNALSDRGAAQLLRHLQRLAEAYLPQYQITLVSE